MQIIRIKDYYGQYQEVPVDDALYEEWLELQRETDRIRKREIYHNAWMPLEEAEQIEASTVNEVLDHIIRQEENERLYAAIARLTPVQQRRVRIYMENLNYSEVARIEKTAFAVVYRSLQLAFKRLRLLLSE